MTTDESRMVQQMATDRMIVEHQQFLDEMISRNEILYQYTEEAIDFARTAEEATDSLVTVCQAIRRLLLIILVLLLIGLVSRVWF